jgi:hypothetical protein
LPYKESKSPVLFNTDFITDIGIIKKENNFEFLLDTSDLSSFISEVEKELEKKLESKSREIGT